MRDCADYALLIGRNLRRFGFSRLASDDAARQQRESQQNARVPAVTSPGKSVRSLTPQAKAARGSTRYAFRRFPARRCHRTGAHSEHVLATRITIKPVISDLWPGSFCNFGSSSPAVSEIQLDRRKNPGRTRCPSAFVIYIYCYDNIYVFARIPRFLNINSAIYSPALGVSLRSIPFRRN